MSEMNVNCRDRERVLQSGSAAEWAALETHAESCTDCADEIRAWKAISVAAREMRNYEPSPELWARIERSLRAQASERLRRHGLWGWLGSWNAIPLVWQAVVAGALVLLLSVSSIWIYRTGTTDGRGGNDALLKNPALAEVERTEAAYMQAIDKLASQAKPELENPATPLLASYKEKLLVLDSAIEDLRMQAGLNPSNAHLRRELLAMYQQKEQTLQDVLEIKQ
jgi:hypothetical protein